MRLLPTGIEQHCAGGIHRLRAFVAARSLPIILWALWTIAIGLTAAVQWHADHIAHHPLNRIALIVHCGVAGVIGLVVVTWLELRLEPWRGTDDRNDSPDDR